MIHLLRMAARIQDLEELQDVQTHFRTRGKGAKAVVIMTTRNMPKRADELMAGGSIYWIVRTAIQARQKILDVAQITDSDGERMCQISLDPQIIRVMPTAQRPMQGWRYLEPAKAPRDLGAFTASESAPPEEMARELKALGLL